ncbi:MAG: EamA family transporter [Flavobacteriales bacterium]|nr:EamA family transporter [Flavobacteriales bacterium]
MSKNKLSHLALILVNLIYGLNYIIAKNVMQNDIPASCFVFLRVFFACILFFCLKFFVVRKEKIEKKDYPLFILCGLFGIAINQLFFFNGLHLTTEVNSSIIMITNPILVVLIAILIRQEKFSTIKTIGIIIGFIGAVSFIIADPSKIHENNILQESFSKNITKGNIMIFINSFSYAIYLILVKRLMKKYNFITVIFYVFLFGLFFVIPFGLKETLSLDLSVLNKNILLGISYVIVFTTFFAYLFNIFALTHLKSSVVSNYIYLQPIFATFFSFLFIKDFYINPISIIPVIFIFSGVYMVSRKKS